MAITIEFNVTPDSDHGPNKFRLGMRLKNGTNVVYQRRQDVAIKATHEALDDTDYDQLFDSIWLIMQRQFSALGNRDTVKTAIDSTVIDITLGAG